jgi:transposase
MLTPEALQRLQRYNFDLLAREEPNGRRRLRYIALAHLKDGKSYTEVAAALRTTRHTVARWERWFERDGLKGLGSKPRYWCNQRLPREQEEAFRVAIEQLQQVRPGGRIRGEDIRQLLAQQFEVTYSLNCVYELLRRLGIVWISARSRSPYADPVRQADFEKKPAAGSAGRSAR